ncbi:chymotrypsinogen B-like [Phascolarctos cinereus]
MAGVGQNERMAKRWHGGCGVPAIEPVLAGPGSWSWQVSLQLTDGFYFCGGSLISQDWVITAAYCKVKLLPAFLSPHTRSYKVVAGEFDQGSDEEDIQVFHYPKYTKLPYNSDFALVKLPTPVRFSATLAPVCIPSASDYFPEDSICVTSSWGRTSYNDYKGPKKLQLAALPLPPVQYLMHEVLGQHDQPRGGVCCSQRGLFLQAFWDSDDRVRSKPVVCTHVTEFLTWVEEILESRLSPQGQG